MPRSDLARHPLDQLAVYKRRRPLEQLAHHLSSGNLTIGFLGGSITEDGEFNWPMAFARWLASSNPGALIRTENAAIGATGTDSACLRVQKEIIETGCQITFLEYSVNDNGTSTEKRNRTREGLIRQLLAAGQQVIIVHTFCQAMYADMLVGSVPASIAEFELLADHYQISSIWVGLQSLRELRQGKMTWGEWLPDGLHPTHRGSWSYAQTIIDFFKEELKDGNLSSPCRTTLDLPPQLYGQNWQNVRLQPLESLSVAGPWVLHRVHTRFHVGQVLETHVPGATFRFSFEGTGLVLMFEYGRRSCEFRYRIDVGEWMQSHRERHEWGGDRDMVQPFLISDSLHPGTHHFEAEIVHGDRTECTGTECRLSLVAILDSGPDQAPL